MSIATAEPELICRNRRLFISLREAAINISSIKKRINSFMYYKRSKSSGNSNPFSLVVFGYRLYYFVFNTAVIEGGNEG
jgi:hypothetical protein